MADALIVIAHLTIRAFEEFERQAVRLIEKHGGALPYALKPVAALPPTGTPDEVHILRFPSQKAFDDYRAAVIAKALA